MYEINVKKKVNKFIYTLSNSQIIREKLEELKHFKTDRRLHLDIERLKGKNKNLYRLRVGEVRFIFEIIKSKKLIVVKLADYRGSIYK